MFPECVAFADVCREVFGDGVKLVYAEENGRSIGNRSEHDPESVVNLKDMVLDSRPMGEIIAERDKRRAK
ncbi:MAG: hypothetical protein K2Q13_03960 [Nitrosomonas sp.]|uniref:hypothetical protein n=1 Tax=Nitrosomonas sp. TaxID=42353 RepID=UPI0025CDA999|nr:hypothetical protein [Nitrosomonas sp.]MBY0474202.1 hypothetical protein [Nitrosomonas sp.]